MGLGLLKGIKKLKARITFTDSHLCLICNHHVGKFIPYKGGWKNLPPLLCALNIVGSDPEHFECPCCGAHDRERHLFMYMQAIGLFETLPDIKVLHFAPEQHLSRLISTAKPTRYICCDLQGFQSKLFILYYNFFRNQGNLK